VKRPVTNPCAWSNRCKRRAPVVLDERERYCKPHAKRLADNLVGLFVKTRDAYTCQACFKAAPGVAIQWAHIITRGAPYIRWLVAPYPGNSIALCQGCHYAYTQNEGNWRRFIDRRWVGHRDRLERIEADGERAGNSVDVADIIREYRGKAA
jgi:hypothetical protein